MDEIIKESTPLALVVTLFQALNEQGIRYCHWKSNSNLDRSIQGLGDLDLLVDRSHNICFKELLYQYDFKPALSPPFRQYPAMEDFLGFDRDSGRLIHLHVHYQLILGEKFVKNYHLPLEQSFLETDHMYAGIKIPAPELEIIMLSMRALLKYRNQDFINSVLSDNTNGLPAHILEEFECLLEQTTMERISSVLESQVAFISSDLIFELLNLIKASSKSGYKLKLLRNRLRRELAPYQRYSHGGAIIRHFRSSFASRRRFLFKRLSPPKKTMTPGGMTIALIGADGAGKSTILKELHKWLSWRLTVRTYYMGSRQHSMLTRMFAWISKMTGYAYRGICSLIGEKNILSRALQGPQRFLRYLYFINIGEDRYSRFVAGQRRASQGALVLYDRYPLEAVRIAGRFMDGPRIASLHQQEMGLVTTTLSGVEQNIYRKILPPDHLFVLNVSTAVSSQRKPDHKQEKLEAKIQSLDKMEQNGLCVTQINADQPLDQALLQIKTALWDLL
jgi:thymidylate kinase